LIKIELQTRRHSEREAALNHKNIKTVLIILILLTAGITYSCSRLKNIDDTEAQNSGKVFSELSEERISLTAEAGDVTSDASLTEQEKVLIHVCGSVVCPGVYECKNGDRVTDAVERAGGFSENAARDFLNLAEPVSDGMKIYVPSADEVRNGSAEKIFSPGDMSVTENMSVRSSEDDKVNINNASKEELMTLSGIGEVRAQSIIDYRNSSGPFKEIEDIRNVSGIKEGSFQKIKDRIRVH